MTPMAEYAFDQADSRARRRLAALEATLDPGTIRLLADRGVGAGWRCLEVGAGGGSIAVWLSELVGSGGHVVATDLDTRFLDAIARPSLEVWRHDVTADELPATAFDLIHVRLVLAHLPARRRALARLVAALKPGGWLVAEEMDFASVVPLPGNGSVALFRRLLKAHHAVLSARGFDPFYGRRLATDLRTVDLCALSTEGRSFTWAGGSVGAKAWGLTFDSLRSELLGTGLVTEQDLTALQAHIANPDFAFQSPVTMAAWGRRPVGGDES